MRLRNDSGYQLNSPDLGRRIDVGEKFEHAEYITGCNRLDPPEEPPSDNGDGSAGDGTPPDDEASGDGGGGANTGDGEQAAAGKTAAKTSRSKGNPA